MEYKKNDTITVMVIDDQGNEKPHEFVVDRNLNDDFDLEEFSRHMVEELYNEYENSQPKHETQGLPNFELLWDFKKGVAEIR